MFTRVMGGVIFLGIVATFAAAISYGLSLAGASLVVVFGLAVSFFMFLAVMSILKALLAPLSYELMYLDPKQRKHLTNQDIRDQNRKQFWTGMARLAVFGLIVYFTIVGIPLLFGTTISEAFGFFTTNPAGTFMAIQLLGVLPVWLFLPLVYLFGFYGPFVIKVLFYDVRRVDRGSEDFDVEREGIIGHDANVERLERMLSNVLNWRELKKFNIRPERGALIFGPPGTGKTEVMRYLAGRHGMAMVFIKSSISKQTFVGVAVLAMAIAQWLTRRHAKRNDNKVLVVIDEIDLLGEKRISPGDARTFNRIISFFLSLMPVGGNSGGDSSGLVVLMTWMDGIEGSSPFWYRLLRGRVNMILDALFIDEWVILGLNKLLGTKISEPPRLPPWKVDWYDGAFFLGTTNRPWAIDEALTRHGRFAKPLFFDLPNAHERGLMARFVLKKIPHGAELDSDEDIAYVVNITEGMPHSDIMGLLERAWTEKLAFVREKDHKVSAENVKLTIADIVKARSDTVYGLAKPSYGRSSFEDRAVTVHESSHACVTAGMSTMLNEHKTVTLPRIIHVSTKPRGRSLGRVESVPVVPVDVKWQTDFDVRIRIALASYAGELAFFGETTSGAGGDLATAALVAAQMHLLFGWSYRECTDEERGKYARLGKALLSSSVRHSALALAQQEHLHYSPVIRNRFGDDRWMDESFVAEALEGALTKEDEREVIAVILGQALVNDYQFIVNNKQSVEKVAARLQEAGGEIEGPDAEKLFDGMQFNPIYQEDEWPNVILKNPFFAGIRRLLP